MHHVKLVLVVLFSLFIIIVAVQNHTAFSTAVTFRIDLLFFKAETSPMSIYFVAVLSFLLGVLLTGLLGIAERFRLKREINSLKKATREKDAELNSLRNLPVTAENINAEQTLPQSGTL